jgi:hypothetical protein
VDATGVGDPIYENLSRAGLKVHPVKFTSAVKKHLIENLAIMIEKREITFPEIPEIINELNMFTLDVGPTGNIRYQAQAGYHDDIVISMALAVDGLRTQVVSSGDL